MRNMQQISSEIAPYSCGSNFAQIYTSGSRSIFL